MKKIGFIGQGWIGKNYADDFEKRGFKVVRYTRSAPHNKNKEEIGTCDIVFIAVPTPTTPQGFDDSAVRSVMGLVGDKKIAVIKSTIALGTTESIQAENPNIFVTHSPEFLREKTAAYDASNPDRNIIGYTEHSKEIAKEILLVLPSTPYSVTIPSKEAELIKYAGNVFLYFKVLFANLLYDLADAKHLDYELIKDALGADTRIGATHLDPVHASGHKNKKGRGAGGHCFIKDFSTFMEMYKEHVGDMLGVDVLEALERKNIDLLMQSNKDADLLEGVYGDAT